MKKRSLGAIGFASGDRWPQADLIQLLARPPAEVHSCEKGEYRLWRSSEGAEAWVHVLHAKPTGAQGASAGQSAAIVGVTPFHRSESVARVVVTGELAICRDDPMAGAFVCYLPALRQGDCALQVEIEMVPFGLTLRTVHPFTAFVELSGLASEAIVYESVADYFKRMTTSRLVSPGAVVPIPAAGEHDGGMAGGGDSHCVAIVTGLVLKCRKVKNSLTGHDYWHLIVGTERGRIDVFSAVAAMRGEPAAGRLVQAKVRLVGRTTNRAEMSGFSEVGPESQSGPTDDGSWGAAEVRRAVAGRPG